MREHVMNNKIHFIVGLSLWLAAPTMAMEIKKEMEYYPHEGNVLTINTKEVLNVEKDIQNLKKEEKEKIITIQFNNPLPKVPIKSILSFNNLLHLKLIDTSITKLPPQIGQLKNLEVLNVSFNQISKLPKEISQLINLKYLYLHHNTLTMLPREIRYLIKLKRLWAENNQIIFITAGIGKLINLENLHIEDNKLTLLPKNIKNLTKLKYLEASGNQITSQGIPTEIKYLTNLISLYLRNNKLRCLKNLIENTRYLTKLVVLDIRGNNQYCQPKECPCLKNLYQVAKKRKKSNKNPIIIQLDDKQREKIKEHNTQ